MTNVRSLRVGGVMLVLAAFLMGLVSASIWAVSNARWAAHLNQARFAGAVLYDSLQAGGALPLGVSVRALEV